MELFPTLMHPDGSSSCMLHTLGAYKIPYYVNHIARQLKHRLSPSQNRPPQNSGAWYRLRISPLEVTVILLLVQKYPPFPPPPSIAKRKKKHKHTIKSTQRMCQISSCSFPPFKLSCLKQNERHTM